LRTKTVCTSHATRDTARTSDDKQLLDAVCAGEPMAWKRLVGRYRGVVDSTARSFRLSEADVADVEQMTWLALLHKPDALHEPQRLGTWLSVAASREALRLLRQRRPLSDDELTDQPCDTRPGAQVLRDAVAQLPPRQRLLLGEIRAEHAARDAETTVWCSTRDERGDPTRARAVDERCRYLRARGPGPTSH
jgi:hypothetical protein